MNAIIRLKCFFFVDGLRDYSGTDGIRSGDSTEAKIERDGVTFEKFLTMVEVRKSAEHGRAYILYSSEMRPRNLHSRIRPESKAR